MVEQDRSRLRRRRTMLNRGWCPSGARENPWTRESTTVRRRKRRTASVEGVTSVDAVRHRRCRKWVSGFSLHGFTLRVSPAVTHGAFLPSAVGKHTILQWGVDTIRAWADAIRMWADGLIAFSNAIRIFSVMPYCICFSFLRMKKNFLWSFSVIRLWEGGLICTDQRIYWKWFFFKF